MPYDIDVCPYLATMSHVESNRGGCLIYVDNLEASLDNEALHDTFSLFGRVLCCKVACDDEGRSKGSGIVHLASAASFSRTKMHCLGLPSSTVKYLTDSQDSGFHFYS